MKRSTGVYTPLLMSVAMVFWGLSFVAIKIALRSYTPISVVSIRLFFVVIILGSVYAASSHRGKLPALKDLPLFLFIGFLNPFLAFLLECTSMVHLSASLASVIMSTMPLFTPLAAFFILKERARPFTLIGLLVSFAGICLIILAGDVESDYTVTGLILIFSAVASGVLYTVFAKKLLNRYSSLAVVTFQQIFGCIFFIPVFLIREVPGVFSHDVFPTGSFLAILFLAVFPSSISYYLFNDGIRKIGPTKANAYTNLTPVVAAVASFFLLNEHLGLMKAAGIAIVITGLFLSQRYKKTVSGDIHVT